MDKNQFEQLKKLVMDLDKSLTRLKSFIDQHEGDAGLDALSNDFGLPPLPSSLPTRHDVTSPPFRSASSINTPTPRSMSMPAPMPAPIPAPIPTPVNKAINTASDKELDITQINPPAPKQQATPLKPMSVAPSTNTVLSPSAAGEITDEIEGSFDGQFLVSATGQKVEVPANYASKSRILYGDMVKAYKENGEQKFKVTTKQPRKKIKALTVKREGKWFVVTGLGSYKIADATADFNNLQVNQEVNVLVPDTNTMVPFAAFDELVSAEQPRLNTPVQTPVAVKSPAPAQTAQRPQVPQTPQTQSPQLPKGQQSPRVSQPQSARNDSNTQQRPPIRNDRNFRPNPPAQAPSQPQQTPAVPSAPVDPALKVVEDFDLV